MSDVQWWIPALAPDGETCAIDVDCGLEVRHGHWRDQIFYDAAEVREAFPDGLPGDGWDDVGSSPLEDVKNWIRQSFTPTRQFGKNQHMNHVHVSLMNGVPTPDLKPGDIVTVQGKAVGPGDTPGGVVTRVEGGQVFMQTGPVNPTKPLDKSKDIPIQSLPQEFQPARSDHAQSRGMSIDFNLNVSPDSPIPSWVMGERLGMTVQSPQSVRIVGNI